MFASGKAASASAVNYIEDVFSTYLYTGTGATQTITNGIDLSTKGGLVWFKNRGSASGNHWLFDSARNNFNNILLTNTTDAQLDVSSFPYDIDPTTSGFSVKGTAVHTNTSGNTYASWTFRKQPKFMTIATWTGNGGASQVISHDLGAVPGFIIVKAYSGTSAASGWWYCYHRSLGNTQAIALNDTGAATTLINFWRNTDPTSTQFTVGSTLNDTSTNFIAYVFAHNAGGFGLTGTDNVISCGSFTTDASGNATVDLGYEPQWLLMKTSSTTGDWVLVDNMRGLPNGGSTNWPTLNPNTSAAEGTYTTSGKGPTATGINITGWYTSATSIYIAIRRGPMKVPTSGTSVFGAGVFTGVGTTTKTLSSGQLGYYDQTWFYSRDYVTYPFNRNIQDRLRGGDLPLGTSSTSGETGLGASSVNFAYNGNSVNLTATTMLDIGTPYVMYAFKRAPSFMDTVCYKGTGANATWSHNLGAVPEMMIVKKRDAATNWAVYHSALGAAGYMLLNTTAASTTSSTFWQSTTPTATSFYTGTNGNVGDSGFNYVAYLFATCPGVSKVGSYTGNGSSQTINCGFTGGARFVMIRRTDGIRDWNYWDSARGIVSGNDPYLALNNTAAEVTTTDAVDPDNSGFTVNHGTSADVNAGGGATYIFLAIA